MKTRELSTPVLVAIAATRGIMGLGAGLLLAKRVPKGKRKKLGWTLFGIGAASTVPLAARVFRHG